MGKGNPQLFDEWPEAYDQWFTTSTGSLVKKFEVELILDLLQPKPGEVILDAGCGTGVFTLDILSNGSHVVGLDISRPMLTRAGKKLKGFPFERVLANMSNLPFPENTFDKVVSVTAIEFIQNAKGAVKELFRVTKRRGRIVLATLNRLSPWAFQRKAEAKKRHTIFEKAIFRSPDELCSLASVKGVTKTAIHFRDGEKANRAVEMEHKGRRKNLNTGALVAVYWRKP